MKGRMTGPSTGVYKTEKRTTRPSLDHKGFDDEMSDNPGHGKKKHNSPSRDQGMDY